MLRFFHLADGTVQQTVMRGAAAALPPGVTWIDMREPTSEEEKCVEKLLGIEVPTREEMQEIETSSRLYEESGVLVMTMPVLDKATTETPESAAITFILAPAALVTLRYADPLPFDMFAKRALRQSDLASSPERALIGLLEQIADRLADLMEVATADIDSLSREIFRPAKGASRNGDHLRDLLKRVGRASDLATRAKDSLLGLSRLGLFLSAHDGTSKEAQEQLTTLLRDAHSIAEHASFLSDRIGFLQDATLGLINIEQSNIIKIFTIAATVLMPPTLVASIYGMNFRHMPELEWTLGYPFALLLMVLAALLPFLFFRHKGWL